MKQLFLKKIFMLCVLAAAGLVLKGGLKAQTGSLPPVVYFAAAQGPGGQVYLNWAVQRPKAGVLYTVQRSADGMFFGTLAMVTAQESADFCFTDSFPATGSRVWYHIIQSNAAGATAITPVRCLVSTESSAAARRPETMENLAPAPKAALGKTALIKP